MEITTNAPPATRHPAGAQPVAIATALTLGLALLFPLFAPFPAAILAIGCLVAYRDSVRKTRMVWMSIATTNGLIAIISPWIYLLYGR